MINCTKTGEIESLGMLNREFYFFTVNKTNIAWNQSKQNKTELSHPFLKFKNNPLLVLEYWVQQCIHLI